ncbi:hypothetical protein KNHN1_13220 [Pseudomonas guariconensis]|uniref:hypothetical protein n=1 Tax=Pseudomonas guariconensis TaxID=1288410 RepID=UPI0036F34CC0
MFNYMFITDTPEIAQYVEAFGVNRIFVDLERNGKVERQGHLNTVISTHNPKNIEKIKLVLRSADLMVRINPFFKGSLDEIEMVLDGGCQSIMIPMFRDLRTLEEFGEIINGRAKVIPLVETIEASRLVKEISSLDFVSEIHIGLNDLHIQHKLNLMFELISNGEVERMVKASLKPIGFGGIAHIGARNVAVPAELVMAEHVRLKSCGVILSRAFHQNAISLQELHEKSNFSEEMKKLVSCRLELLKTHKDHLDAKHAELCRVINKVVRND